MASNKQNKIKIIVSCSGKFHAFSLAEQLEKNGMLESLFVSFSSIKNPIAKYLITRRDRENIPKSKIQTNLFIAVGIKLFKNPFLWNSLFDRWVAWRIKKSEANVFIGWSGMSEHSLKVAKRKGMVTILERGSTHISYQNEILKKEYKKFGTDFGIDINVINKELKEYELADYISIASSFVNKSFIKMGISEDKLIVNPYGANTEFFKNTNINRSEKFIIIYFGALMHRKGIIYMFEALNKLNIQITEYEVWFVGNVTQEIENIIENYKKVNWVFKGHIDQKNLAEIITQGSIGVVPSIEDGFGMVVPQMLACNVPVIVSENTGASDLIIDGKNGFVVPIRDSKAISEKIQELYHKPSKLQEMKYYMADNPIDLSWDAYGQRYINFIDAICD